MAVWYILNRKNISIIRKKIRIKINNDGFFSLVFPEKHFFPFGMIFAKKRII